MKTLIEKAFFLKKVKLFQELDLELLLSIAEKLHEDDYDAEEKVFSQHQVANRLYLIFEGEVQIIHPEHGSVKSLESAEYFGDESLFNEEARAYSAFCKCNTILFTLSRSHMLAIISECPSVAISLLGMYAKELPCRYSPEPLGVE